jgi:hypothetical protein
MMEEHPTLKKLRELAEESPYFVDPSNYSFDPSAIGLTRLQAAKQMVRKMPSFARGKELKVNKEALNTVSKFISEAENIPFWKETVERGEGIREVMREALEIIRNTPKKTMEMLKEIKLAPPLSRAENYAGSGYIHGHQSPQSPRIELRVAPSWNTFRSTLPKSLSHETGHAVTESLLNKKGYTLKDVYEFLDKKLEGIAEYYSVMKDKQPPLWGHGEGQEKVFGQIPTRSKNIEYNMMRYLDEVLANSSVLPNPTLMAEKIKKIGGRVK